MPDIQSEIPQFNPELDVPTQPLGDGVPVGQVTSEQPLVGEDFVRGATDPAEDQRYK